MLRSPDLRRQVGWASARFASRLDDSSQIVGERAGYILVVKSCGLTALLFYLLGLYTVHTLLGLLGLLALLGQMEVL